MKFKELQKIFDTYRLYKDRGVVRMLAATVIANQVIGPRRKPVWVMFVAPPGGGKSDITDTISTVETYNDILGTNSKLCEEISDLTTASFASGMRSSEGETSLLKRLNPKGGMLLFKDFTTVLSKRSEDMAAIMSYLREMYDGKFNKKFGNGKVVDWKGQVGIIGSCTTIIYHKLPELAVMGDRLMMYQIDQPDRLAVLDKIWENEDAGIDGSEEMAEAMKKYIEDTVGFIKASTEKINKLSVDKSKRAEFGAVANFVCFARSGVIWDFQKKRLEFVPDAEMPTRILRQFIALSQGLMILNMAEGQPAELTVNDTKLVYKLAFDSISSSRRNVIKIVASFEYGATDQGIADTLGLQLESAMIPVEELVATGVINRVYESGIKKYKYTINPDFLPIIQRYEHIETKAEMLQSEDVDIDDDSFGGF